MGLRVQGLGFGAWGSLMCYMGVIKGYIGMMEKKMEITRGTTIGYRVQEHSKKPYRNLPQPVHMRTLSKTETVLRETIISLKFGRPQPLL